MKTESDRIAAIVNSLLRFSTKQSKDYREIDIIKLLQQMVNEVSASRSIGNVAVDLALDQELPLVTAHEDDLKTVIRHLLDNAYDAMPEGGTLHISADLVTSDSNRSDDQPLLEIKIADSGCGIIETTSIRCSTPFSQPRISATGWG
jgi:two-component system, sporulation sensor kinase E